MNPGGPEPSGDARFRLGEPAVNGFTAADHEYMARALRLAERGLYTTDPNPRVGCVIVAGGRIVGEGWHERAGEPHAEVHALRAAGAAARGATAYVTLEPCAHHGRTAPCTEALVTAGVARVVAALPDPNPSVAGGGMPQLAAAGIETATGLLAAPAEALNAGFLRRVRGGRPWLRVKLAASLDGRTAMASGESRWITGAAARTGVHRWRARSSAVLTGIGTVPADDPRLTARGLDAPVLQPRRYVVDPDLRLPATAALVKDGGEVTVYCCRPERERERQRQLEAAGVMVRTVAMDEAGRVDLPAMLADMRADELNEILVEAGPTLAGALLEAGVVDELLLYQALHLLGDRGRPLVFLREMERMAERRRLRLVDVRRVGEDLRLTLTVA